MSLAFTSFVFDSAEYSPGATITLTVDYTSTDTASSASIANAVTVTLSDAASGSVAQASDGSASFPMFSTSVPATGAEPVSVSASDNRATPGTWALVSNTPGPETVAPFSGIAILTSTA